MFHFGSYDRIEAKTISDALQCVEANWIESMSFEFDDGPENSPFLLIFKVSGIKRPVTVKEAGVALDMLFNDEPDVYRRIRDNEATEADLDMFLQFCLFRDIHFDIQ
jgi:hypothetical protein